MIEQKEILKKSYNTRDIQLKEDVTQNDVDKIFKTIDINVYFDRENDFVAFTDPETEFASLKEQFEHNKEFIVEGWLKYYAEDEEIKQFLHLLEKETYLR